MKKLEKLGMWLAGISIVACTYFAIVSYRNINVGEALAWITAAAWAATSFILELKVHGKDSK